MKAQKVKNLELFLAQWQDYTEDTQDSYVINCLCGEDNTIDKYCHITTTGENDG